MSLLPVPGQYSGRSICNIGTRITKIWICILDVISTIWIYIYIPEYVHIYIHILDITSRIHIHIWRPPGRLNGGVWGGGCPPRNQVKFRLLAAPGQYIDFTWNPHAPPSWDEPEEYN